MSRVQQLPIDQLAALQADDVQLYLASHGWKRDDVASTSLASVYHIPEAAEAEVVLPIQRHVGDFLERMADVVEIVAAVEERSVWQVLADLSAPPADVLRLQVAAADATLGTLPLDDGIRLIDGARSLLLAAACSARQTAAFFPRQAYKEAVDFLETCQLGQTERGSFIAKIVAPVPPQISKQSTLFNGDDDTFLATEPFARRSTVRLMTGLRHIRNSIDTGLYDQILDGIDHGVSANLCEAVASMQPKGDQAQLRIRMTWSRSRPHVPTSATHVVEFSQTAFEIVREAGRKLREEPQSGRRRIEGRVITLKAEPSLLDDFEGTVVLRASIAGAAVRVQVLLNARDYKGACDAHRDGRTVSVTGILQREAKLYHLLQPHDFTVLASNQQADLEDGVPPT